MEMGKGLFFAGDAINQSSDTQWRGTIRFGKAEYPACVTCKLDADPLPTMDLVIEGKAVFGLLEMNANQASRTEPDLLNFITVDGQQYAAGVWIPRKKQRKKWFLLFLIPTDPSRRASTEKRNLTSATLKIL